MAGQDNELINVHHKRIAALIAGDLEPDHPDLDALQLQLNIARD